MSNPVDRDRTHQLVALVNNLRPSSSKMQLRHRLTDLAAGKQVKPFNITRMQEMLAKAFADSSEGKRSPFRLTVTKTGDKGEKAYTLNVEPNDTPLPQFWAPHHDGGTLVVCAEPLFFFDETEKRFI